MRGLFRQMQLQTMPSQRQQQQQHLGRLAVGIEHEVQQLQQQRLQQLTVRVVQQLLLRLGFHSGVMRDG
jgi:hypothetical protein